MNVVIHSQPETITSRRRAQVPSQKGVIMGGGGTAPKMKMSDAFILTGLTLLLGGLFMHAWVTPSTTKRPTHLTPMEPP